MAAQQFIQFNGGRQPWLTWNGTSMDEGYMNGTHVFTTLLRLNLPQHGAPINLRTFINANNPDGRTRIIVTNSLTQPRLDTGNLAGLTVELINNGQFQGAFQNDKGMNITSALTVTNNGWIRGGGRNGVNGGAGSAGGTGATAASKTVNYIQTQFYGTGTTLEIDYVAGSYGAIVQTGGPAGITVSYHSHGPNWNIAQLTGPCGDTIYAQTFQGAGMNGFSTSPAGPFVPFGVPFCGVTGDSASDDATGGMHLHFGPGTWILGAGSHVIAGGPGGAGGAGGAGGIGGVGQWYNHARTNGTAGSAGTGGVAGTRYTWTDPTGVTHLGNLGATGGTGSAGTAGTNGGTWGVIGNATAGWALVLGGSLIGNMSGTRG